eukprot:997252-Rhodomonas_salina.1
MTATMTSTSSVAPPSAHQRSAKSPNHRQALPSTLSPPCCRPIRQALRTRKQGQQCHLENSQRRASSSAQMTTARD